MAQNLSDIDSDEVSPVRRGAIRKKFNFLKSDDDKVTLAKSLVEALADPAEDEGALLDLLRKSDVDEDAQEAVIASMRLLKGFEGDLPEALAANFAEILKQAAAGELADPGDPDDIAKSAEVAKRGFSADERRTMAGNGEALSDGSFPIANTGDLRNAVHAIGRASDESRAKDHIVSRARSLGALDALPDTWAVSKSADDLGSATDKKELVMGDAPSVPVRKSDGGWDLSGVDEAQRPFYETVLKGMDDAVAESKVLAERVEKAEDKNAELESKLLEKDLVLKADSFKNVGERDDVVAVLKSAKESMSDEQYTALEELLTKAEAKIETGALFAELGASQDSVIKEAIRKGVVPDTGGGDAWEQIEKGAKALIEKSDEDISEAAAIDRFLKTDEGKRLYADYVSERGVA